MVAFVMGMCSLNGQTSYRDTMVSVAVSLLLLQGPIGFVAAWCWLQTIPACLVCLTVLIGEELRNCAIVSAVCTSLMSQTPGVIDAVKRGNTYLPKV